MNTNTNTNPPQGPRARRMSAPRLTVRLHCPGCRLVHLGHDLAEVQAEVDAHVAARGTR
jgi:hypothetical protein